MRNLKSIVISCAIGLMLSATSFAANHSLKSGWNLIGAGTEPIAVSKILENTAVRNVLIYQNGNYLSSASNSFTTIPAGAGYFVYADRATKLSISTSNIAPSTLRKLDVDLNTTDNDDWPILHIVDAGLYVEMKDTQYYAALKFNPKEAEQYCANLTKGNITGWRLPTGTELAGISAIYRASATNQEYFKISVNTPYYWSSSIGPWGGNSVSTYLLVTINITSGDVSSAYTEYLPALCVKDVN